MAEVVNDEDVKAITVTLLNCRPAIIDHEERMSDSLSQYGLAPSIDYILDIKGTGKNGANSIVVSSDFARSVSNSHDSRTSIRESVADLRAAFEEAGFKMPETRISLGTRISRALTAFGS